METITSYQNPLIKRIRRLSQKKYRQKEEAYFIEGLRLVLSAVEADSAIDTLIYCPDLLTSESGWKLVRQFEKSQKPAVPISKDLFKKISTRDNPIGLGAVLPVKTFTLDDLKVAANSIFLGLVRISDPGNLGTIIRTADAVGVAAIIMTGDSVDLHHPAAIKGGMGTHFFMPVCTVENEDALLNWAAENELQIVASSAGAKSSFRDVNYELPALLLAGSEKLGLSQRMINAASASVRIPMLGQASSLNLSVAVGLLLYEMRRS